jgi:hypothetical protein
VVCFSVRGLCLCTKAGTIPAAPYTRGMEVLIIVLTAVSILIGGVAAGAAIRSVVLTRRGLEIQQEQLRLQREQASKVPELECSDVWFLDPEAVEEVLDTLKEMEEGKQEEERKKAEREQYQRELAAWEARRSLSGIGSFLPRPQDPENSPLSYLNHMHLDPLTSAQRDYRGPVPDAVMVVQLENKGRTAARDITGSISLHKDILELLDFPRLDADEVSGPDEDGFLTAEVSVIGELLPKHRGSFRVAVMIHLPPEETVTELRYDFITPAGHATTGEWEIPIPGSTSD